MPGLEHGPSGCLLARAFSLLQRALLGRPRGDPDWSVECLAESPGCLGIALLLEPPSNGSDVLHGRKRQPVLVRDEHGHLGPPQAVPAEADDRPVVTGKIVRSVLVVAPVLPVDHAAVPRVGEPELLLEPPPEAGAYRVRPDSRKRVEVDVIDRAIRSKCDRAGDEFLHLIAQALRDEAARLKHDHLVVALQIEEVPRQGWPAFSPGGAGEKAHRC